MTREEQLERRIEQLENALVSKGIDIQRTDPIILGRPPRGKPNLVVMILKIAASKCCLKLISQGQSADDIFVRDWDVSIILEPGASPMMRISGWVELSDCRLMAVQHVWAKGPVDTDAKIEQGDCLALSFNGQPWEVEAIVTKVRGAKVFFEGVMRGPAKEPRPVNLYTEFRPSGKLLDPQSGRELIVENVRVMRKTIIKGWATGRIGSNLVWNGYGQDVHSFEQAIANGKHRQIEIWCSQYSNASGEIEMVVELPSRAQEITSARSAGSGRLRG
jgi:hypothetical protein